MVNFLVYIQINNLKDISYGNEILSWAKNQVQGLEFLDLDNHSEIFIVEKALEVMKKGEKVLIFVDSKLQRTDIGYVTKILNTFLRLHQTEKQMIMVGENPVVRRMAATLRQENFHVQPDLDTQKNIIKSFFTN